MWSTITVSLHDHSTKALNLNIGTVFGTIVLVVAIIEMIIGCLSLHDCPAQPLLPYMLIINGCINIVQVYSRNLANSGNLDYLIVSVIRMISLFTFVNGEYSSKNTINVDLFFPVVVLVFMIDSTDIVNTNPNPLFFEQVPISNDVKFCNKMLYDFSWYISVSMITIILILCLFGLVAIVYMVDKTKYNILTSKLSSAQASTSVVRNQMLSNLEKMNI